MSFSWSEVWGGLLNIIIIVVVCQVLVLLLSYFYDRRFAKNGSRGNTRAGTINTLMKSVTKYLLYFIAALMILEVLGINYMPVIASAGVVGVAVGFGAQSLVKDIISGLFIMLEDTYRVGEYVTAAAVSGFVEEFGLRTTKLRDWGNELRVIPNGQIDKVTNYSRGNLYSFLQIPVGYTANLPLVYAAIEKACGRLTEEKGFANPPRILGVDGVTATGMMIKVAFEASINEKDSIELLLREYCRDALDEAAINITG